MTSIENLRNRVAKVGRNAAVVEEMLRLGFITKEDFTQANVNEKEVNKILAELKPTNEELFQIQSRLATLGDMESMLREIRAERIEIVKARREEKKLRKAEETALRRENWERLKRTSAPFLGVGVSERLSFIETDDKKLSEANLPILNSLSDIAKAMELTTDDLVWLCYERATSYTDHYSRFEIPKRSGGKRLISSPKPKMRVAQSWINENLLSQLSPSKYAFAFRPKTSILHNAEKHVDKQVIIKLDIKDFFPTITFSRVRGYFEFLGYNPGVSTVFALVCTDAPRVKLTLNGKTQIVAVGPRSLPQGACTSPALSNLIASRLDARFAGLISEKFGGGWTYTRYADDLTFSTNETDAEIGQLIAAISKISKDEGFTLNVKKTRIMRAPKRQSVTGLIVDKEVRIPKSTIKKMRALFHNIDTKGKETVSDELKKDALSVARGYWAYLFMVNPTLANRYLKKYTWLVK